MRKSLLCGLVVASIGLAAVAAQAKIVSLGKSGAWSASGGTTDSGKGICTMSSSGSGLWFGVKLFQGDDELTVQVSHDKWTVKDGNKIKVTMKIDRESPWTATATGFHMSDGDAALEFAIPAKQIKPFLIEFMKGRTMYLGFPESKVSDWEISLTGSQSIVSKFGDCVEKL